MLLVETPLYYRTHFASGYAPPINKKNMYNVFQNLSHLGCTCTARSRFLFLWQTVSTNSHRRELTSEAAGIFFWISSGYMMSYYVVCVLSEGRSAPSLKVFSQPTWRSEREAERRRSEVKFYYGNHTHRNIEIICTGWQPSSSISICCSLFPVLSLSPFSSSHNSKN